MVMIKDDESGLVQISDDVIAIIANTAALEVEGVVTTHSGIAEILGKKNFSKGVKVEINDSQVSLAINLSVKFGYKIPDVMLEVQKKIKSSIETMTGLLVTEINVNVIGINFDKEKK